MEIKGQMQLVVDEKGNNSYNGIYIFNCYIEMVIEELNI